MEKIMNSYLEKLNQFLQLPNLLQYFDELIIFSKVDVVKSEKEIFELALSRTNLKSAECIYIGDNYYDDIVGCQKMAIIWQSGIEELNYQSYLNTYQIVNKLIS